MLRSLVGSEMCIRDSKTAGRKQRSGGQRPFARPPYSCEVHVFAEPRFQKFHLQNPGFRLRSLRNPGFRHCPLRNPGFRPCSLQNPGFRFCPLQNPGFRCWLLQNPGFTAWALQNPGFRRAEQNPGFVRDRGFATANWGFARRLIFFRRGRILFTVAKPRFHSRAACARLATHRDSAFSYRWSSLALA